MLKVIMTWDLWSQQELFMKLWSILFDLVLSFCASQKSATTLPWTVSQELSSKKSYVNFRLINQADYLDIHSGGHMVSDNSQHI